MPDGGGVNRSDVTLTSKADRSRIYELEADRDGNFKFDNVIPGEYRIVAGPGISSNDLYGEAKLTVSAGENLTLNLVVRPVGIDVSAFVTIAADKGQPVEQVSKTVDVIDAPQMRDRADFALIESVRTIPGFRVQQLGGFGKAASIKTRGLRNQDTAVLIDGIRFRDPAAITGDASPFLSDITLTSVERMEVLRGSGSSLYGTNAIGGVLDFQTPSARHGTHGQLSGAFGGLGLGRFRGNLSHGGAKFGIGGGVSHTTYRKGIDGNDDADNTNVQARLDAAPNAKTNISGRIFLSDADVKLNVSPDTLGTLPTSTSTIINASPGVNFTPDVDDPDARQNSRFISGQIAVNQIINWNLSIGGHYQGLDTSRRNIDGLLGPGFQSAYSSAFDGQIHTANAHLIWTAGRRNTLTAGYEFESERFGNDNTTPAGTDNWSARTRQDSNTFYVQDLVSLLGGDLQFAGGFRFQSFDLKQPQFSAAVPSVLTQTAISPPSARTFDGAVSYFIEKTGTKLRAHVGNGYRVPSLYERFGSYYFLGAFFPLGNPALKPEKSIGIDGGIEQYFAKERVKASATYFYTRIKDEITYLPTDDFGASAYYNFDRHYSRGLETSIDIRPDKGPTLFASYTFTNSDLRAHRRPTFPVGPVTSIEQPSFGIPEHQFTFVATQRFKRFWVNFDLLATSSYLARMFSNSTFNTYIYRFRGNRRGDVTAGYTFRLKDESMTLRLYGTIENVFDNDYYENGYRTAKANGRVGLTFGF
ncbi:MAG: TonB-dependent receptor [Chloracidobacterium sp.]|nr:TonB-dependent receptor [Chloracidobacterium sp.]